jgi:hypothetical protein
MSHIKNMEQLPVGFTKKQVKSLAYELAKADGCSKPFRDDDSMRGVDWFHDF